MGSAFHQLCPRYSGTLTPTAPTAIRLWETFTFFTVGTLRNWSKVQWNLSPILDSDLILLRDVYPTNKYLFPDQTVTLEAI